MGEHHVKETCTDSHQSHGNDVIDTHCCTVTSYTALPFDVVKYICKECHKYIGAREAADILYKLPNQYNCHVSRSDRADYASKSIENEAIHSCISLSNLLGNRPYCKYSDSHWDTADYTDKGLCNTIVIRTENIVAVIDKTKVLECCTECKDKEVYKYDQSILISKDDLQLGRERYFFLLFTNRLFCNSFLSKVILQKCQRKGKKRED